MGAWPAAQPVARQRAARRAKSQDNNRIFIAGYSTGGWLANMWGCYFGGTPSPPLDEPDLALGLVQRKFAPRWAVRGRASQSGALPPNQPLPCNGPSAGNFQLMAAQP